MDRKRKSIRNYYHLRHTIQAKKFKIIKKMSEKIWKIDISKLLASREAFEIKKLFTKKFRNNFSLNPY